MAFTQEKERKNFGLPKFEDKFLSLSYREREKRSATSAKHI